VYYTSYVRIEILSALTEYTIHLTEECLLGSDPKLLSDMDKSDSNKIVFISNGRTDCSSGNAGDLHSGGARFESQPGHRITWLGDFLGVLHSLEASGPDGTSIRPRLFPSTSFSHHPKIGAV
jgi:hypothetical protein